MEESDEKIQAKLEGLLDQVRRLKIMRDAADDKPNERSKSHELTSDIFRHFSIIDWMIKGLSSEDAIAAVKNKVSIARRETRSESNDLELLSIRQIKRDADGITQQYDPFPYTKLLPEIREKILGFLTSPQDKLNILKVLPDEAILMHWDPTNFYFQLIFPIVMKHSPLNFLDAWRLGRVNPSFRKATFNYFEDNMIDIQAHDIRDEPPYNRWETEAEFNLLETTVSKDVESGPDWCRENPILMPMFLRTSYEIGGLEECGSRFWYLSISTSVNDFNEGEDCLLDQPEFLLKCLCQLPNLKGLVVRDHPDKEVEETKLKALELPKLPYLRYLRAIGSSSTLGLLLSWYGQTLESLFLHQSTKLSRVGGTGPIICPRLWKMEANSRGGTVTDLTRTLLRFTVSPLKIIILDLCDQDDMSKSFPEFMIALSRFGGTLEELELSAPMLCKGNLYAFYSQPYCCNCCCQSSWITDLSFPRLKKYSHIRATPGTWAHLLQFPNLEELSLRHIVLVTQDEFIERENGDRSRLSWEEEEMLGLSWDVEEMYKSKLWKLLPRLEKLSLSKFHDHHDVIVNISRLECIKFQRK